MNDIFEISDYTKSDVATRISEALCTPQDSECHPMPDYSIKIDNDFLFPERKEKNTERIIGKIKI